MAYKMNDNLNNYDIFPKVLAAGVPAEITIKPLGCRDIFEPKQTYDVLVCPLDDGNPRDFPASSGYRRISLTFREDRCFKFTHTFDSEQEYFLRFFKPGTDERILQLSVYCVEGDFAERYPYMGDLHMHTTCSDGRQSPEVVCANYRRYGYDFTVISDHHQYYPSLRAIKFYSQVKTGLNIIPGEEVHLPPVHGKRNNVHIVNFGGEYSINSLVEDVAVRLVGKDLSVRAIRTDNVPDVMTLEEYEEKMQALADSIEVPEGVDALPAAVSRWIFDEIRKAGGLAIFPHPNWIDDVYHVPERLSDYFFETHAFDAFEVLGGERYYEANGFQTLRYYDQAMKGNRVPVVGSTDSHSSYPSNPKAFVCETLVLAKKNERREIIDSVKNYYSVAIDTINEDYRIVGPNRLARYTSFLLNHYFPLHDELCFEEGRLMKVYATGTDDEKQEAKRLLEAIAGRTDRLMKKYFAF